MKFTLIPYFLVLGGALIQALPSDEQTDISTVVAEPDIIISNGLRGSRCSKGDPLNNSPKYSYRESCQSRSSCTSSGKGYYVNNYCSGGNQCCIYSQCSSPYTSYSCYDSN
ncbi:hypothetical protein F5884DRAFT_901301, partial [Xylogone sp. PMI_703]